MILTGFITIGMIFTLLTLLVGDLVILAFYRAEVNCVKANNKYLGNPDYYYKLLMAFGKVTGIYAIMVLVTMALIGLL